MATGSEAAMESVGAVESSERLWGRTRCCSGKEKRTPVPVTCYTCRQGGLRHVEADTHNRRTAVRRAGPDTGAGRCRAAGRVVRANGAGPRPRGGRLTAVPPGTRPGRPPRLVEEARADQGPAGCPGAVGRGPQGSQ